MTEQLPNCSPPGCPFPIKSLALSAHMSPWTIHFWVLDESPVSGPGRGPPSCNKIATVQTPVLVILKHVSKFFDSVLIKKQSLSLLPLDIYWLWWLLNNRIISDATWILSLSHKEIRLPPSCFLEHGLRALNDHVRIPTSLKTLYRKETRRTQREMHEKPQLLESCQLRGNRLMRSC